MPRQLNVRSDEAYRLATDLAKRTGRSRADVVRAALLAYGQRKSILKLTPEQQTFVAELMALAERSARSAPAGMTSDHSSLYDEKGLPR
jgi:hypothetical protein